MQKEWADALGWHLQLLAGPTSGEATKTVSHHPKKVVQDFSHKIGCMDIRSQ